ncbi:MAG: HemK2/MTQ2 family protein methyltransferase [Euryarchaeota archaeon]|nr:HemK2/MTQ2 family protein methyltransferase [Euryarchaeota archaeon]
MVHIEYRNVRINLADDVYEPAEDSFLLADAAVENVRNGMHVLEVGVGTGFVCAVLNANRDVHLLATEINPHAATCARSNGIDVIRTDMFAGIRTSHHFDMIIFNPPYLPTTDDEKVPGWLNYAFDGGTDGRAGVVRFLDEVIDHLCPTGTILLLVSSLTGIEAVRCLMVSSGFIVDEVGRSKCFFEELVVLRGVLVD